MKEKRSRQTERKQKVKESLLVGAKSRASTHVSVNIRMAHPTAAEVALWPVPCVSSPALNGEGHLPNPSEDHFNVGNIQTASEKKAKDDSEFWEPK